MVKSSAPFAKQFNFQRKSLSKLSPFWTQYLEIINVYDSQTSEEHRPSMNKWSQKQHTLPSHGKLQHVKWRRCIWVWRVACGYWLILVHSNSDFKLKPRPLTHLPHRSLVMIHENDIPSRADIRVFFAVVLITCFAYTNLACTMDEWNPFKDYAQCEDCEDKYHLKTKIFCQIVLIALYSVLHAHCVRPRLSRLAA